MVATCSPDLAELVADGLWGFGPAAIEEQADGPHAVLLAGFDDTTVADLAAVAARELGCLRVEVVPVTDHGLDGWRDWASVEQAGPFVLAPAWLAIPDVGSDQHLVRLDPGHTFGSGSHPTTRAVLQVLTSLVGPTTTVLDVGSGSGVLAVAAALLGAPAVYGIDVDGESPSVVATNAAANGVGAAVTASDEPLSAVAERGDRFDVVAANLLAPVIVELAGDLRSVVTHGGALVLSGLLADRWRETVDRVTDVQDADVAGDGAVWTVGDVVVLEGWAAVVLRHGVQEADR